MLRKIISIDTEKCNGCGLCVDACHEGAIGLVDGKATLLRDDYCDGLGDCLPACPTDAISFVSREAAPYNEAAVIAHQMAQAKAASAPVMSGCPGSASKSFTPAAPAADDGQSRPSQLRQWPVELKLINPASAVFENSDLLVAADCTAFAYGDFHRDFMTGKATVIGCPKLDAVDYSEKLQAIIESHAIRSITVARMEVPCCGGIEMALRNAVSRSGKKIPVEVVTFATDGAVLSCMTDLFRNSLPL